MDIKRDKYLNDLLNRMHKEDKVVSVSEDVKVVSSI